MSYFDEMTATERIPDSHEHWTKYRQMVTDYIEKNCPVKDTGDGKRPILALWGIGQAGDIDIGRLAAAYKLVLIDRDEQAVREAVLAHYLKLIKLLICDIQGHIISVIPPDIGRLVIVCVAATTYIVTVVGIIIR